MIKRSTRIRLEDILETLDGAQELMKDISFEQYKADFEKRMALERCVEIISEATRHIPEALKAKYPESFWPEIKAIGNLLRHEYQRVDNLIMWRIAKVYFPDLRRVITAMLSQGDEK